MLHDKSKPMEFEPKQASDIAADLDGQIAVTRNFCDID